MKQVLVGRIERMVDSEILSAGKDCARDVDAAKKVPRPGAAGLRIDSIAAEVVRSPLEKSPRAVGTTSTLSCGAAKAKNSWTAGRTAAAFSKNSLAAGVAVVRLEITTAAEGYDRVPTALA